MASEAQQTFADLIRGMQHAVNTAQEMLHDYQFQLVKKYFDDNGFPIMQDIRLSDGRVVEVPWITLVPQSLLAIDEIDLDFAIQVASAETKGFIKSAHNKTQQANNGVAPPRSSFTVAFARRASFLGGLFGKDKAQEGQAQQEPFDTIDVKIKFKSVDLPEGAQRVLDMLNVGIGEKKDQNAPDTGRRR
jgi:hypothetical protein